MKKLILVIVLLIVNCTLIIENCMCQVWSSLGSGMEGAVTSLTIYNNELIAGGSFTTAGGVSANRIAKWNGTSWSPLGSGMGGLVSALIVYNNELIAGGYFKTAGGDSASNIAKWNGTSWSTLGSGTNFNVNSLAIFNNELIVGGFFQFAGGVPVNSIAKWNGTIWDSLGGGVFFPQTWNPQVFDLTTFNNNLIVGGAFSKAGGISASNIAKWNGTNWSALGSGISGVVDSAGNIPMVRALNSFNNELIVGGSFTSAGGLSTRCIAKWNGTNWSTFGTGLNNGASVLFLATFNNELIVGGGFNNISGFNARNIVKWNGTNWSTLGSGLNNAARSFVIYNNQLIVGGAFDTAGGIVAHKIAKWWLPFSISGTVHYSDNNQPLTSGKVKAFKLDKNTMDVIYLDSANIQSDGSYTLSNVPQDSLDIGVFPNSTPPCDWVITYFPSTIYWENATVLYPTGNLTNINISAIRMIASTNSNSVNGKVMRLTDNPLVGNLKDAVLYAKNGNTFVRSTVSDANGVYHLQSLPTGNLKILATRPGFIRDSINVNVTSASNVDSINFYLNRISVGIKQINSIIPSEYKLFQNYPNPFNPVTNIRFYIKENDFVSLKVFNILGKEVSTLVNEKLSAGEYEIQFNNSQLASGLYLYTLNTPKFTETKKMLLIK